MIEYMFSISTPTKNEKSFCSQANDRVDVVLEKQRLQVRKNEILGCFGYVSFLVAGPVFGSWVAGF